MTVISVWNLNVTSDKLTITDAKIVEKKNVKIAMYI